MGDGGGARRRGGRRGSRHLAARRRRVYPRLSQCPAARAARAAAALLARAACRAAFRGTAACGEPRRARHVELRLAPRRLRRRARLLKLELQPRPLRLQLGEEPTAAAAAAAATAAAAAAAAKENAEMQRAPAIACPSQATKRCAPRPKLQPKLPPSKQPRLGGLASAAAAARRPLQTLAVS